MEKQEEEEKRTWQCSRPDTRKWFIHIFIKLLFAVNALLSKDSTHIKSVISTSGCPLYKNLSHHFTHFWMWLPFRTSIWDKFPNYNDFQNFHVRKGIAIYEQLHLPRCTISFVTPLLLCRHKFSNLKSKLLWMHCRKCVLTYTEILYYTYTLTHTDF